MKPPLERPRFEQHNCLKNKTKTTTALLILLLAITVLLFKVSCEIGDNPTNEPENHATALLQALLFAGTIFTAIASVYTAIQLGLNIRYYRRNQYQRNASALYNQAAIALSKIDDKSLPTLYPYPYAAYATPPNSIRFQNHSLHHHSFGNHPPDNIIVFRDQHASNIPTFNLSIISNLLEYKIQQILQPTHSQTSQSSHMQR